MPCSESHLNRNKSNFMLFTQPRASLVKVGFGDRKNSVAYGKFDSNVTVGSFARFWSAIYRLVIIHDVDGLY